MFVILNFLTSFIFYTISDSQYACESKYDTFMLKIMKKTHAQNHEKKLMLKISLKISVKILLSLLSLEIDGDEMLCRLKSNRNVSNTCRKEILMKNQLLLKTE